ncbi:hypothetical protein VTN02DRAFT_5399 [Thermoascus thermophilus]
MAHGPGKLTENIVYTWYQVHLCDRPDLVRFSMAVLYAAARRGLTDIRPATPHEDVVPRFFAEGLWGIKHGRPSEKKREHRDDVSAPVVGKDQQDESRPARDF